jgi:hypothetical protein
MIAWFVPAWDEADGMNLENGKLSAGVEFGIFATICRRLMILKTAPTKLSTKVCRQ